MSFLQSRFSEIHLETVVWWIYPVENSGTTNFVFSFIGETPLRRETGLGEVEHATVVGKFVSAKNKKRKAYRKYTGRERYQIGKYASENGNTAAVRHFKGNNLNESTVREFKKTYQIRMQNTKAYPEKKFTYCCPRQTEKNASTGWKDTKILVGD